MCYWIATEICTQPELKNRVKAVENWIKVARVCFKLRNYSSSMAIVSGLNVVAVSRLKHTWEQVDPKRMKQLNEIEHFLSPVSNHRQYRVAIDQILESGQYNIPVIPILSVFLKDLIFMNDGNSKYLPNTDKMINFEKLKTIYASVMRMVKLQRSSYDNLLPDVPTETLEYCSRMHALKEDALYKYSCLCEAKNGDGDTLRLRDKWMQQSK